MLKSLFEITKQLLGIAKDTRENKDSVKALQTRLEIVTDTVKQVIMELQRLKENEAHEREKMALRLENTLLRSERNLLSSSATEQTRLASVEDKTQTLQAEVQALRHRIDRLET